MSTEIESLFGNVCRTCMIQDNEADTEFQSIFDAIPNSDKRISDLLNILMECNIVMGMPNRMCGKCVQRIGDVHEFQQLCLQTQSKYRQLTEDGKYTAEIVVSTDQISDATLEESDPLREDDCTSEEIVEAGEKEDPAQDVRPPSSLSSDDDFNWPSEEEMCDTESNEVASHIQTNEETYECDICHLKFAKAKGMYHHRYKKHPPKNGLVCGICGQIFKKRGFFNRHTLSHNNDDKNGGKKKRIRKKKEKKEATLLQNEEGSNASQSQNTPKTKVCDICHKVFTNIRYLSIHKSIHTGEKNCLCKDCGKSFRCPKDLIAHEKRHAGVRQYECPICPKKFVEKGNLHAHKRIHSDLKPHVCDVCDAAFKFPYTLKKHKLYHGEKLVKCEQCDTRFYTRDTMRRHMLTHTGEKPYKCKYCERAFAQPNDLILHLRTHVGKNVYRCELCPMGFPLLKEMRKHFALHKNDDEATRKKNLEALAEYKRNSSQQIKSDKEIHV